MTLESARMTALATLLASAPLACGRTPIDLPNDGPTVGAEIYALGFCSLKCYRIDQCGLAGGVPKETCQQECIDDALRVLPVDPCWAEWIEVRRCWVRETDCDGLEDEELPANADFVCDRRERELDACESGA